MSLFFFPIFTKSKLFLSLWEVKSICPKWVSEPALLVAGGGAVRGEFTRQGPWVPGHEGVAVGSADVLLLYGAFNN